MRPRKPTLRTDQVTLSVIMYRLQSICREMTVTLERTARSPIFTDAHDFSTAIFDGKDRLISQEEDLVIPIQTAAASFALRSSSAFFGKEIFPGDVILVNDPYSGGNHLADLTTIVPVFFKAKRLFAAVCRGQQVDTGGSVAGGYNPNATEIYQEGLRIPPVKLFEKGKMRKDVFNLILKNVRYEQAQRGDLMAQVAAARIGERRLLEATRHFGVKDLTNAIDDLIRYGEYRMRQEIAKIPGGRYIGSSFLDDDGMGSKMIKIQVAVGVKGSEMTIDFTGSSSQVKSFVNSSLANTYSATFVALLSCVDYDIPHNEGCYKPIEVVAPPGTVVNANHPSPVGLCTTDVGNEIIEAIWKALAKGIPKDVSAGWDRTCTAVTTGIDPRTGKKFSTFHLQYHGGAGAMWGMDGWNHLGPPIGLGGQIVPPIEMMEVKYPFLTTEFNFRKSSAGAGQWRGGLGVTYRTTPLCDIEVVTFGDGIVNPPFALMGGRPGKPNVLRVVHTDGTSTLLPSKSVTTMKKREEFEINSAGGGGIGDPLERDIQLVSEDAANGYISIEDAREEYGVVLDPNSFQVDRYKTEELRRRNGSKT